MAIELKVPEVGESITEVMVGEWLKKEGDHVEKGEAIVIIETDKVNAEVEAPESGVITKIHKDDGDDAEVGEVIGLMEAGEKSGDDESGEDSAEKSKSEKSKSEESKSSSKGSKSKKSDESEKSEKSEDDAKIMPAARRLAAEKGVDLDDVEGSGPGGRVLKEDVQRHLESADKKKGEEKKSEEKKSEEKKGEEKKSARAASPAPSTGGARETERVKMTPLRRRVASRLVEAQHNAALLTTFNEIDMSAVMALRSSYKQAFVEKYDIKLGFMSFFIKATIEALKEVPQVNAQIDGEEIIFHNYFDIGVAVGGGKGLVVPVVRNAERLSFSEVEQQIADYASRAQKGTLKLEELQGGTFTISNGGVYGSLLSTPILNPPQSGILGLHKIEERPVAVDGQVEIRPMMYVALTYDHRIVDGREAVTFLVKIKERIEDPARILLEV